MKIITSIYFLFFIFVTNNLFAQQDKLSRNSVLNNGLPSTSPFAFKFGSGTVGGLDSGSFFNPATNFTSSRWWSIGRLPKVTQTVFGLCFQLPNKAVTFGYRDVNDANPRIEWISTINPTGNNNLEFRAANSFTSTATTLIATMKSNGTTVFGENLINFCSLNLGKSPKIGITHNIAEIAISIVGRNPGILITIPIPSISIFYQSGFDGVTGTGSIGVNVDMQNNAFKKTGYSHNSFNAYENIGYRTNIGTQTTNGRTKSFVNTGFLCRVNNASQNRGVYFQALATNFTLVNYEVCGEASGGASSYGIYGAAPTTNVNYFARYFNDKIFSTGSGTFGGSDARFKEEVNQESKILEKLKQLRAINFKFKENEYLNFPAELQHGFITQELEKIFPELVTNIKHPIFEKASEDDNLNKNEYSKEVKFYEFKAVNYTGLISVLTSAVLKLDQKYDDEIQSLNEKIENLKKESLCNKKFNNDLEKGNYEMSQNIPNPFNNQSTINYTLPENEKSASIAIFDFNGKFIKEFKLS